MIGTHTTGFGACLLILQALLFNQRIGLDRNREQPISGFRRAIRIRYADFTEARMPAWEKIASSAV